MESFRHSDDEDISVAFEDGIAHFWVAYDIVEFHFNEWFQRVARSQDVRTIGIPTRYYEISQQTGYPLYYEVSIRYMERII